MTATSADNLVTRLRPVVLRAEWPHGWKLPPKAFEPAPIAYFIGYLEAGAGQRVDAKSPEWRRLAAGFVGELLGDEGRAKVNEAFDALEVGEEQAMNAYELGCDEALADSTRSTSDPSASTWGSLLYLDIVPERRAAALYSYSRPRR